MGDLSQLGLFDSPDAEPRPPGGNLRGKGGRVDRGLPECEFLGWERPLLHSVSNRLIKSSGKRGPADLSGILVVLPGARAARRLKELLVDRAEEAGRALRPPEIVTVGRLPERLYPCELPAPDPVAERLSWQRALETLDPSSLLELAERPTEPGARAPEVAADLAGLVERLHREVSAAGIGFREVAGLCRRAGFSDERRWLLLAAVQDRYHALLARQGLRDVAESRRLALSSSTISTEKELWVACVPDLPPIVRAFLTHLATSAPGGALRILVGAPTELARAFDALGCVEPEAWEGLRAGVPDAAVHIASSPGAQADTLIRCLSELNGEPSAEEITIGAPDPEVIPYVTERLAEQGVEARYAGGRPLAATGLFGLLTALAGYLESPDSHAFGSLLRYPALEEEMAGRARAPEGGWSGVWDRYQALHLQARIDRGGLLPDGGERVSLPLRPAVKRARDALSSLLAELSGVRRLAEWAPVLSRLVLTLLLRQRGLPACSPTEERDLEAFAESAGPVLEQLERLPSELDALVGAPQALRFLMDQLRRTVVPPDPVEDAVELLGWLELALDDASHMAVCGFNEPHVPGSVTSDPFLPHALRSAVGLLDNRARWARDLLYLRTIRETRAALILVCGRWDGDGNPVLPSRLLFAEEDATVVGRVERCFGDPTSRESTAAAGPAVAAEADAAASPFGLPPEPAIRAEAPPDRIPVTAFRSLLRDPYRYALERVLRLERVDDRAQELDAMAFGSLAHAVLAEFGAHEAVAATDGAVVGAALEEILSAEIRARFGSRPLPAVRLQMGHLRARLRAFGAWQAGWAARGWRIRRTEVSPEGGGAPLLVDGTPVLLTGKLDRIDFNGRTGEWCVLDYKTGEGGASPETTHQAGPRNARRWTDLQLPLYRLLAGALEDGGGAPLIPEDERPRVRVGYVVIPSNLRVRELLAGWGPSEFAAAEQRARDLVRELRGNCFEYDPKTSTIQPGDPLAAVVGGGVLRLPGTGADPAWTGG